MQTKQTNCGEPAERKFPIRCTDCGAKAMHPTTTAYTGSVNHDGKAYDISVPKLQIIKCRKCGEELHGLEADRQISMALRAKRKLLTPEQIAVNIESLGFQQKEFAARIGVAPETVSRWANGNIIQSRAMDMLMRAFFGCPEIREKLLGPMMDAAFGEHVVIGHHLHK